MHEHEVFTTDVREAYLKLYGKNVISFTTFAPGMEYFDVVGKGYITYQRAPVGNFTYGLFRSCCCPCIGSKDAFALGDPICADADVPHLLSQFLAAWPNGHAQFFQLSESASQILRKDHGFYMTQYCVSYRIGLADWTLSGKKKHNIRIAVNAGKKKQIQVRENFDITHEETMRIADSWLKTRTVSKELKYFVRPPDMPYNVGVRKFIAYDKDGTAIGFVFYDPVWENNKVIGYVPSVCRGDPEFAQGLVYVINVHAMDIFKNEGVKWIDLGASPQLKDRSELTYVRKDGQYTWKSRLPDRKPHGDSRFSHEMFRYLFEHFSFLYNWQGINLNKSKYCGTQIPMYMCHKQWFPICQIIGLGSLFGVL